MDVFDALRTMIKQRSIVRFASTQLSFEVRCVLKHQSNLILARDEKLVDPIRRWETWITLQTFLIAYARVSKDVRFMLVRRGKVTSVDTLVSSESLWLRGAKRPSYLRLDIFDAMRLAVERGGAIVTADCGSWQCVAATGSAVRVRQPDAPNPRNALTLSHCLPVCDFLIRFRNKTVAWTKENDGRL